ncbi:ExeM/NucH family extracellular endonuclease [Litoreibacter roseus]|uniref:Endonuclease/exonuclease/phosphatase domain-containing protein n=1 Tax=Litoreibacter roseus TaxID=2601869 RepID=A0A6N6JDV7_9RHOB|nr:ExeM/NucH family extracellular endonuclease [Litoreibacter roseus]GFE64324.1 hypothetical protein KIN_13980 [Litoreibacter roseus]
MRRDIFASDFNDFLGNGFGAEPAVGQLDSDLWSVAGFNSAADLARGATTGGETTGGIYALEREGDNALWIQPGGSDFTPGALTLTLDTGETDLSDVTISYDLLSLNNTERANALNLSVSINGGAFMDMASFVTPEASSDAGIEIEAFSVTLPGTLPAGSTLVLQFEGNDVSGSGSRDEYGIDNLVVDGEIGGDGGGGSSELFVESFEGEPGVTYTLSGAFDDGGFDFFGRFAAPDPANGARDDFNQFDGNFAIYAQDNDGDGGPATQSIEIPNVDLTGYAAPTVTMALGALDSSSFDNYEAGDGIRVFATLDGGDRVLIGQFLNDGTPGNLLQDTDLSGFGDGTVLTTSLQDFTFDLPEGDVLSLEIELTSNDGFEPLVVDNVRIGDDSDGGGSGGGDGSIDDDPTLISAVQGDGDDSPLVGETVVIEGIVTGDFQNGDADEFRNLGGFFVMEEVEDRDENDLTSEGVFAFEDGDFTTDVSAGDKVRVLGTVVERFGKTTIEVTEVRIEEAAAADPLSLAVSVALPDTDVREALEGMLVTIDEPLTFTETFNYEDFGEATLSTDGPIYQYSQLNTPDAVGNAAYQEEVANRSILIDDGTNGRRADFSPITEPDGDLFDNPDGPRMGQELEPITAIFDYDFSNYRLRLPDAAAFEVREETNPFEPEPLSVGSDYKVASLNVLNYFTTIDGTTDNGSNPRGADSAEELARQTDKLVTTILGMDADVIGLIEMENDFEGEDAAIVQLVAEINARLGSETWAYVDPGQEFVGDDAIAVAFIYDTSTTALVGSMSILDTPEFLDPLGDETSGDGFNRAAIAQTFEEIETGGEFTASVNHFKSKGSLTGAAADEDQGDGAGRNNATRTEAARELSEWLATDPTNSGDDDVIILGDLNSYARETPITTLEDAGYTDLARAFEGDDVYSYRFSGQIGTLDYALANESLLDQVTGATTWNINSDAPVFFDYNLDGTFVDPLRPTDQGLFDGSSPSRGSDHDPVIIGLDLESDDPIVLTGTTGNDRINGTDADEIIQGLGGRLDKVLGGGGADTFVFGDIDGRRDSLRILDFNVDEDILDLNGAEIAGSRSLGSTLRIALEEDRDVIYLSGVSDIDLITFADDIFTS